MKRNFIFQSLMLLCTLILGTGSVYADDAKWVKRDISKIQTGDIVVIADLNAGVAMTNNPAEDKSPNAPAIQLNEDKDRITGEVADTVKWKVTVKETDAGNKYVFEKYNEDGTYLNITDGNLRVSAVTARYSFDLQSVLLHLAAGSNEYYVGIKTSNNIINTSTEWNVKTEDNITEIRDTRMAFFVLSTKPDITLSFPYKNYEADYADGAESFTAPALTVDPSKTITYSSSDEKVATVDADGKVILKKRGNVRITASFDGDDTYNEISTSYVLRVDQKDKKGSRTNPFTVKEATDLLAGNVDDIEGVTYQKGCSYFVKGIVSKVSSGMMDSFSDMFGDSMGDMDLEDMMGDIDMSNMNIPGMDMSSSEVTYYISDDGTKENQMKVLKPNGLPTEQDGGAVTFDPIAPEGIGVGDVVVVYGPLIYTEDESMFGGMGGTGTGTGTGSSEQKYTAKVDEVNYIKKDGLLRRLLPGDVKVMYENTKKPLDAFYKLNTKDFEGFKFPAEGTIVNDAQMKSSKKDVAKWEYTSEAKTDSLFSAVKAGTTNLVVKIKVIVQEKNPNDESSKEKSYTMKAKYPLKVLTRGVTPAGQNDGVYELVTKLDDLEEGDRLLIATTVDDKSYVLINSATDESNPIASFMGGGNTKEVTIEDNKISSDDLPEEAMILTLEKEDAFWLFNGGKNADGKNTYLYPSASSGGFDMSSLMGGGGATLKLGVREDMEVQDSCLVTITIDHEKNDSATVKFNIPDGEKDGETVKAKNVIRYKSSMMSSSFSGFEETLADGNLPRIYRFVQSDQYTISTTSSTWQTLVSAYDVLLPDEIEAHVVTSVTEKSVNTEKVTSVKGGVPYLLKVPSTVEDITLKRAETPATAPEKNLLEISDSETTSGVYVLADKGTGAKFYLWQGGLLGSGRVYLPANDAARSLFSLEIGDDETTGVIELKNSRIEELEFYDLSGHRVMTPKKGVYVVNGKKVIIK